MRHNLTKVTHSTQKSMFTVIQKIFTDQGKRYLIPMCVTLQVYAAPSLVFVPIRTWRSGDIISTCCFPYCFWEVYATEIIQTREEKKEWRLSPVSLLEATTSAAIWKNSCFRASGLKRWLHSNYHSFFCLYMNKHSSNGRDVFALCIHGDQSELLLYVTVELCSSWFLLFS